MRPAVMDINAIKERMRATWMAGDFGVIAAYTADAAKSFVARLNVVSGTGFSMLRAAQATQRSRLHAQAPSSQEWTSPLT